MSTVQTRPGLLVELQPKAVRAIQWTGQNLPEIHLFLRETDCYAVLREHRTLWLMNPDMTVGRTEWILKDEMSRITVIPQGEFDRTCRIVSTEA